MTLRNFLSLFVVLYFAFFNFGTLHAATITVTQKDDSFNMGNCSLRDAVQSVNQVSNQGGCSFTGAFGTDDTILLEAGTYTLSLGSTGEDANADGDLDIIKPVVIQGAGADLTTVTGGFPAGEEDRIFAVCPDIQCLSDTIVTMRNFEVSNGGSTTFQNSGGGILASESFMPPGQVQLELQDCQISGNNLDPSGFSSGGGISNDGADILMERCLVTGNHAFIGGGIVTINGLMAINESTIDGNTATVNGGGIQSGNSELFLYNSTVSNNQSGPAPDQFNPLGGGITLEQVCNATAVIANSTISGNSASDGGGIFAVPCNDGLVLGIKFGAPGVLRSGVFLFNSTIASNEALGSVQSNGEGGGIHFSSVGEGIVELANTILAGNEAQSGPDCFDNLSSRGFNLFGNDTGCTINAVTANPDQTNVDPLLGPLQNNGGPTQTHGLPENSLAIDMGNNLINEGCMAPDFATLLDGSFTEMVLTRDQRNFPRPIAVRDPNNPICDVGAFEFQTFAFNITKDDGLGGVSIPTGTSFDYTINITNNGPGTATAVTLDDPLPAGMDFVSVTTSQGTCAGNTTITCDLGDIPEGGTATVTVNVVATATGAFTNTATLTLNNPFQQTLNQTAQVTTNVGGGGGGLSVFGSGFGCRMQAAAPSHSPGLVWMMPLMGLVILGLYWKFRKHVQD